MITLYAKTGCRFAAKVIAALDAYGLSFVKKNIEREEFKKELIELGGKKQTPYLVDGAVHLYESDEIIAYIEKTYGKDVPQSTPKPRMYLAKGGDVCPS